MHHDGMISFAPSQMFADETLIFVMIPWSNKSQGIT